MIQNVDQIYEQYVRPLSDTQQLRLVERIAAGLAMLQQDAPLQQRSILELHGKGAQLWEHIDPNAYVDRLRDEWDHRP
jgi:hypothetical protein